MAVEEGNIAGPIAKDDEILARTRLGGEAVQKMRGGREDHVRGREVGHVSVDIRRGTNSVEAVHEKGARLIGQKYGCCCRCEGRRKMLMSWMARKVGRYRCGCLRIEGKKDSFE